MSREIKSKKQERLNAGFSLIEIMVSMSVFIVIIVISMGSILSVLDANKKSQSLRAVMDNLNFTLESMTRTIRFGTEYHCGGGHITSPQDCGSGGDTMTVLSSAGQRVTYSLILDGHVNRIARVVDTDPMEYITSPDVNITRLTFYVYGSDLYNGGADQLQPQAIIVIGGYAGLKPTIESSFILETTVSQRTFDFQ